MEWPDENEESILGGGYNGTCRGHYSHLTGSVLRGGGISDWAAAYGPPRVVVIAQKTKNAAN